jgi:hypothetical protein
LEDVAPPRLDECAEDSLRRHESAVWLGVALETSLDLHKRRLV